MIIRSLTDVQQITLRDFNSVPIEKRRSLPNCSAVYMVITDNDECLYVGQAGKGDGGLVLRWTQHELLKLVNEYSGLTIRWIECDEYFLNQAEQYFIRQMRPQLNKVKYGALSKKIENEIKLGRYAIYELLRDKDLTGDCLRIWLVLFLSLEFNNYVVVSQADLSRQTGLDRSQVSKVIKILEDKKIIEKGIKFGACYSYRFNSDNAWQHQHTMIKAKLRRFN